jgi:hypothetical protein
MKLTKPIFLIATFFICNNGNAQSDTGNISIYGKWICVATDYRGYQKFTAKQAALLKKSILHIDSSKMYYDSIHFLDVCTYASIKYRKGLEKDDWSGTSFYYRYSEKDLAGMIACEPVDGKGTWSCYNDCALLYLKNDTLINICGGYTLMFKKIMANRR